MKQHTTKRQASATPTSVPLLFAAPIAVVGGFVMHLAFPGYYVPGAEFVGLALVIIALWNQRGIHGLWLGLISGAAFWLPLIDWLTLYLGIVPWAALAGAMILWTTLLAGSIASVTVRLSTRFRPTLVLAVLQTLIVAGLWTAKEAIQSTFPYDGFGWGRLAHTQSDGPLLHLVAYVGFAGLTALIVTIVTLPVAYAFVRLQVQTARPVGRTLPAVALAAVLGVGVLLVPATVNVPTMEQTGTASIAGVQGNSESGLFDDRENGDVIADHVRVTREWLGDNPPPVDAVVWPENSAEFNILGHQRNLASVRQLVRESGAPFVVGSILDEGTGEERHTTNSSLVLQPDTQALTRYDKRFPVPFAEYMPHRAFYRALVPDLVDLVQLEYAHGTTDTVLEVADFRAGVAICFDIIFDEMASLMNEEGAQIVFAQTNNADFGRTDQSEQQLEIARLRAVEMGRVVVNISTVATSQMIGPAGEVLAEIPQWTPGVMQAEVPLFEGSTPALKYGTLISTVLIVFGLMGYVGSLWVTRKQRP